MLALKRVGIVLVVLLTALSPLHVAAQQAKVLRPISPQTEDALLQDAEIYAANMGISVDQAMARFQLQDLVGQLDAELSENEPGTFAGLWMEPTPDFHLVVQFTENGEQTLKPYLDEKLAGSTEVRSAKFPLAHLEQIQKQIMPAVWSLGIPVESQVNVPENLVELFIADRARFDEAVRVHSLQLPEAVKVITVARMGQPQTEIYGGLGIGNGCTSGFSVVRNSDGVPGITTAGHCDNYGSYNGSSLTYVTEILTGSYDIEWFRAPGFTVTNKIQWWSDGSTRGITSTTARAYQAIGAYVCKYGVNSHYTCGYISSKTFCPAFIPNCGATYIRVDNTAGYSPLVLGGDSGGPWFYGNSAYGTTVAVPGDDPNDGIYMAVNYVGGLGVSVMTAP